MTKKRLCIAADEFGERRSEFVELLKSDENRAYIGSLKFSEHMFTERGWLEDLALEYRLRNGHNLTVIADLSLSGGYDASVKEVDAAMRLFGFQDIYFVIGRVPRDEMTHIIQNCTAYPGDRTPKFLLTGALPENDPESFYEEYGLSPEAYTLKKAQMVRQVGAHGIYAAAHLVPDLPLFSIGAGISVDGEAYTSGGVKKSAITVQDGLQRCSQIAVGNALKAAGGSLQENLDVLKLQIDAATVFSEPVAV